MAGLQAIEAPPDHPRHEPPAVAPPPLHDDGLDRPGMWGPTEPTPRPAGIDPNIPFEPRLARRSTLKHSVWSRFIEYFMESPLQGVVAAVVGVYGRMFVHDDGTSGADVPDEPGSWMFATVGDYGSGSLHEARVATQILLARPSMLLTVGDNVYPFGRWSDYATNYDPAHMYGNLARRIPIMPSIGNHDEVYKDDLQPYFAHFPHLKGRPYYSFTKDNVDFFSLDGDEDLRPGSIQYRWLEQQLKRSKTTWRIIYLHYPFHSDEVGDFEEIRSALTPLLRKYRVQLVLSGHVHNYQRSNPIDGTVHIITGNGGQQVFASRRKRPKEVAFRQAVYGYVQVSVGPTRLVVRAYDEDGRLFDATTILASAVDDAAAAARSISTSAAPR